MKFIIDLVEGLIFGVLLTILIRILGIEVTAFQAGILAAFAIIVITILNSIGMALKGKIDAKKAR